MPQQKHQEQPNTQTGRLGVAISPVMRYYLDYENQNATY